MKRVAAATVAGLLLLLSGTAWQIRRTMQPVDAAADEQVFVVANGSTLGRVARDLEEAGLLRRAWAFELLGRWQGRGTDLRAGDYLLSAALTPQQILERLVRGEVQTHPFSIPEGLTAAEIAQRFEDAGLGSAEDFLALTRDPAFAAELGVNAESLEGYLFPETYRWARGLPLRDLVRDMVEQFHETFAPLAPAAKSAELSPHEVVILASIVEKETGAPQERPLIAAVFLNRLAKGMRLETDPTVIYGIPDFDGNLRRNHLEDASNPYNTYRIPALPPGPIANPGAAALQAVVQPADADALFFVSKNDGTHHFSKTYAEHVRAVDTYQRRRRSR